MQVTCSFIVNSVWKHFFQMEYGRVVVAKGETDKKQNVENDSRNNRP